MEIDVRRTQVDASRLINRTSFVLFAFGLLLVAARCWDAWRLNEALVDEIGRFRARAWPRPPLVDRPLPGTFGEHLERALAERLRADPDASAEKLPEDCIDGLTAFRFGWRHVPMPERCFRAAEERLPAARAVLEATHAEQGGPPAFEWRTPTDGRTPIGEHFSATIGVAMVAAMARVNDGRYGEALALCRDMLALGRDLSLGGGTDATYARAASTYNSTLVCAPAMSRADARTRREFLTALRRLGSVQPVFADLIAQESLKTRLEFFSDALTEAQRRRLADPPLPFPAWRVSDRTVLPLRVLAMRRLTRFEAQRVEAARSPKSYPAQLEPLQAALADSWNPFLENAGGRGHQHARQLVELHAAADTKVELLVAALEATLSPARLWAAEAGGEPVQLGFDASGRLHFGVRNPNVTGLPLENVLIPELAGEPEPGGLLRLTR